MDQESSNYLVIADLPPPTQGISIVSSWVAQFLSERNSRTIVVNTSAKTGSFYMTRRIFKFTIAFFKVFRSDSKTSIYMALSHGQTLYAQALILLTCKLKKNRVIVHHHTFLPINRPNMLQNRICHGLMKKDVEHIFLSDYMEKKYKKFWKPRGKCWVVTNHQVAYLRTISQKGKYKKDLGNKLCFAGRLDQEKGFWDCEYITRDLLTNVSEMKAVFLGPVTDKEISQAIEYLKKDFPTRFHHIEMYDEFVLSKILLETTYFLFPSRYSNEASPLVVLEAQALGNICITSNVGSLCTDVLSPGSAVEIEVWHKKVSEIVQANRSDISTARLISERVRDKSVNLALLCDNQLKEVFQL